MASITVRNLDETIKKRLRLRAAEHGRSLEAEVRDILRQSADAPPTSHAQTGLDLFRGIREVVEKFGGADQVIALNRGMVFFTLEDNLSRST